MTYPRGVATHIVEYVQTKNSIRKAGKFLPKILFRRQKVTK